MTPTSSVAACHDSDAVPSPPTAVTGPGADGATASPATGVSRSAATSAAESALR